MDRSLQLFRIYQRAPGRFTFAGELDMATASELDELTDVHRPLLLDMGDVSFIDAAGIASLVRLYKGCENDGCSFLIEACSPIVERVLRIVGLYEIFTEAASGHRPDLPPPDPAMEPAAAARD
jgi:anti-sigma B factor antagonist